MGRVIRLSEDQELLVKIIFQSELLEQKVRNDWQKVLKKFGILCNIFGLRLLLGNFSVNYCSAIIRVQRTFWNGKRQAATDSEKHFSSY